MDGTDSTPPTEAGLGGIDEDMGERVGQRGSNDRPTEALFGTEEVWGTASVAGDRMHFFLVEAKQNPRCLVKY